jgi:type II secretion system protein H
MQRVAPAPMLILETGKFDKGFTLLEILAVLTLIGLIVAFAYPRVFLADEKVALKLSGDLLASDLRQMKEAAAFNQTETKIYFTEHSYHFKVGEVELEREFSEAQIDFAFPKTENGDAPSGTEPVEERPQALELIFKPDGSCNGLSLSWETKHFKGSLAVDQEGTSKWSYAPK